MSEYIENCRALKGPARYWKPLTLTEPQVIDYYLYSDEDYDKVTELKEELSSSCRTFDRDADLDRLLHLLDRKDKGLLSYERCTYEELLKFCAQRRLSIPRTTKNKQCSTLDTDIVARHPHISRFKRTQLIDALEHADEQPSFTSFTDLAPELRNLIYSFSFEYFQLPSRSALSSPVPSPPVTRVSRLLRREALPLFLQTQELEVYLPALRERTEHGYEYGMHGMEKSYIETCPSLAALHRKIMLRVEWPGRRRGEQKYTHWEIKLDVQGKGYYMCFHEAAELSKFDVGNVIQGADKNLRQLIDSIVEEFDEEEAVELRQKDWQNVVSIFNDARMEFDRQSGK